MQFIAFGGFLGAGKTTTMLAVGRLLEARGETVSIVTNDQGVDLVDTAMARAAQLGEVQEVTGGCFCCRFDDLASVIQGLAETAHPTVVLAEAVGSCTDMQSTVVRPLRHFYGEQLSVAPLTVLVDPVRYAGLSALWQDPDTEPDLAYLFRHQLDEADVIAVNKADLLGPGEAETLCAAIRESFPHARVLSYSAATGEGLEELLSVWSSQPPADAHTPFAVDYDRYGAAEAELAWTNQTLVLSAAADEGFAPAGWVRQFLTTLSAAAAQRGAVVGHVKLRVTAPDGVTKASLTGAGSAPSFDEEQWIPAHEAAVVLNARVQVSPDELEEMIAAAAGSADQAVGASSSGRAGDIFQPGFPVPVHRM